MDLKYEQSAGDEVDDATQTYGVYKGVPHDDARRILGDEMFARMMADKIRCQGPTPESVYPWNVRSYLTIRDQEQGP